MGLKNNENKDEWGEDSGNKWKIEAGFLSQGLFIGTKRNNRGEPSLVFCSSPAPPLSQSASRNGCVSGISLENIHLTC